MKHTLIIIRGNSGSGKTTVARQVRSELGDNVMFIEQDVLRHDILKVGYKENNPVVRLIESMATYGLNQGYTVLLEGVLSEVKYGDMLRRLIAGCDDTYVYYFEIPFEETLRRHELRQKREDFGEIEMKKWWKEKDYLHVENEQILNDKFSEDELVTHIVKNIVE